MDRRRIHHLTLCSGLVSRWIISTLSALKLQKKKRKIWDKLTLLNYVPQLPIMILTIIVNACNKKTVRIVFSQL